MSDKITSTDELLSFVRTLLPEGFTLDPSVHTGGNCMASVVTAPDSRTLYLTDGNYRLPLVASDDDETPREVIFGYYDADDTEDGYLTMPVDDGLADNVRAYVDSWVLGDPYRDITDGYDLR